MFSNITPVVKNIIILNVLVFLACFALPGLHEQVAGHYFASPLFRPWQIFTHMFAHDQKNIMHIFFNMEKMVGPDFEKGLANMKALAEK